MARPPREREPDEPSIRYASLVQFQCQKEGTLFYYQTDRIGSLSHIVEYCPVCGSKRIDVTGRQFPALEDESPEILFSTLYRPDVEKRIMRAFKTLKNSVFDRRCKTELFYEHGQWWTRVTDGDDTYTFSVVDANTKSGFAFEGV